MSDDRACEFEASMAALRQTDPERLQATLDKARRSAETFGMALNVMATLAAPRVLASYSADMLEKTSQEWGADRLNELCELLQENAGRAGQEAKNEQLLRSAQLIRDHLRERALSSPAPSEIVIAAREFLDAMGAGAPTVGWDAWDGTPEV